jgi:hypothetical protein
MNKRQGRTAIQKEELAIDLEQTVSDITRVAWNTDVDVTLIMSTATARS